MSEISDIFATFALEVQEARLLMYSVTLVVWAIAAFVLCNVRYLLVVVKPLNHQKDRY